MSNHEVIKCVRNQEMAYKKFLEADKKTDEAIQKFESLHSKEKGNKK